MWYTERGFLFSLIVALKEELSSLLSILNRPHASTPALAFFFFFPLFSITVFDQSIAGAGIEPSTFWMANKEEDLSDDKGNRKKEVEEKLKVLNEKKHNLVQVLKQILHVEEELKRRSSVQGTAIRPSAAPPHVDASADSGSMTRQLAHRVGSEVNASGDTEGGEADDLMNHNVLSRQMLRNSSMSPSSESPLRRPAHIHPNMGSHPSRANFSVTGSPLCLPPTGQSGLPPNLPTVSVSGTNYIASSPSPAASGGTSVLRDARQPSPWN